jgi:hypothetical protein
MNPAILFIILSIGCGGCEQSLYAGCLSSEQTALYRLSGSGSKKGTKSEFGLSGFFLERNQINP